jgi:hypothetical protein
VTFSRSVDEGPKPTAGSGSVALLSAQHDDKGISGAKGREYRRKMGQLFWMTLAR